MDEFSAQNGACLTFCIQVKQCCQGHRWVEEHSQHIMHQVDPGIGKHAYKQALVQPPHHLHTEHAQYHCRIHMLLLHGC